MTIVGIACLSSSCKKEESVSDRAASRQKPEASRSAAEEKKIISATEDQAAEPTEKVVVPTKKDEPKKAVTKKVASTATNRDANGNLPGDAEYKPYEIVKDPTKYKVLGGGPGLVRGDKIYSHTTLPKDACGTYWVREENGMINQMSLCRGEDCLSH